MSNLSELLPAGGAAKEFEFVASGTLPNGKAVILKANGQIEVVAETTVTPSMPLGTTVNFVSQAFEYSVIAADPHNNTRWAAVWTDDAGTKYVRVIIITRSGTTLSVSSISDAYTNGNASSPCIAWDENTANNFLLTFNNVNNRGSAIVGTVAGSVGSETISYGSLLNQYSSIAIYGPTLSALGTSGNYLLTWGHSSNNYPYGRILTVSGTTVSVTGSDTVLASTAMAGTSFQSHALNATDSTKALLCYIDNYNRYINGVSLSISGTTITPSTSVQLGTDQYEDGAADPHIQTVSATTYLCSARASGAGYGYSFIITDNGSTLSAGTRAAFSSTAVSNISSSNNKASPNTFSVMYKSTTGYPTGVVGSISGTSITFNTATVLDSTNNLLNFPDLSQQSDTNGNFVGMFRSSNSIGGYFVLGYTGDTVTNLTSTNFVGITAEAITSGATGVVVPQGGVATNLSSLTIGSNYYVQADGTVSTVSTSPAVNIGKAISATSLILKG
jgi:hypothetical protein